MAIARQPRRPRATLSTPTLPRSAEPARTGLVQLREIIRSAVPKEAVEVISYGIPAFALSKAFFGYAAFKNHLSVLPFSGSLFNSFSEELKPYTRTKSSLHLPFDKPLPAALIRKLVRSRVAAIPSSTRRSETIRKLPLHYPNRFLGLPWIKL